MCIPQAWRSRDASSQARMLSKRSGSQSSQYSVGLSWDPSSSPVVGYNVYRGTQSGGPYQKLNLSPQPGTSYTDATVQSGVTYFYVATAVAPDLVESRHSNQTSATIP